jgi:tetratricopeptide (TPR) repeat protein
MPLARRFIDWLNDYPIFTRVPVSMKQAIAILLYLHVLLISGLAQTSKDSLLAALRYEKSDTVLISLNIKLSEAYSDEDLAIASQYALTAVEMAQKQPEVKPRVKALFQAGNLFFYAGLFNRSVDYFTQALNIAENSGDLMLHGDACFNLGGVYNILGDHRRSRELTDMGFQMYATHYRKKGEKIPADVLIYYRNNMGLIYMKEGKTAEAKHFFLEAIRLSKNSPNKEYVTKPMTSLAELLISAGEQDSARQLLTDLVLYHESYGIKAGLSVALALLGDLYMKQSETDRALTLYKKSFSLAKERKDLYVQERVSENIAQIYQSKGMTDSALHYFEQHHKLSESSEKSKASQTLMQKDLERRLKDQEASALHRIQLERSILGILAGASLGLLLFFVIRYRKRSVLERNQASLSEEKLRLEKKQLQEALELKDKQLAAQVMYSLQKNEMISDLVSRIKETATQTPDGQKGSLGKIIRDIEADSTEAWKEFEQRFQEVHAGFYERLMAKYPDLTSNERRLCAFLRLDMSTKEISNLTGQSVKAITQARFRLRAKLGIENPDNSLFEVLLQI